MAPGTVFSMRHVHSHRVVYPDDDLLLVVEGGASHYSHKDGRPHPAAPTPRPTRATPP